MCNWDTVPTSNASQSNMAGLCTRSRRRSSHGWREMLWLLNSRKADSRAWYNTKHDTDRGNEKRIKPTGYCIRLFIANGRDQRPYTASWYDHPIPCHTHTHSQSSHQHQQQAQAQHIRSHSILSDGSVSRHGRTTNDNSSSSHVIIIPHMCEPECKCFSMEKLSVSICWESRRRRRRRHTSQRCRLRMHFFVFMFIKYIFVKIFVWYMFD